MADRRTTREGNKLHDNHFHEREQRQDHFLSVYIVELDVEQALCNRHLNNKDKLVCF